MGQLDDQAGGGYGHIGVSCTWKSVVERCLCELANLGLMAKPVFSTSECWRFAVSNLPEKHSGSFFSSLQQLC